MLNRYWLILFKCYIFLLLAFASSCTTSGRKSDALQAVLDEAGMNRNEILKVLTHYESVDKDILKLEAANFLIENMYLHEVVFDSVYNE